MGAHVLSMVRAHYPLINLKRLEAGYPKEVDLDKTEELRMTQLDLSAKIIGDINLCGGGTTPVQGTPSRSQLETPSVLSQPAKPAVSTSQASAGPSSLARQYKSPRDSSTMSGLASSRCRVTRPANSIGCSYIRRCNCVIVNLGLFRQACNNVTVSLISLFVLYKMYLSLELVLV